ncbi:hypothetical protein GCM10027566_00470 [Arachidicoccus ginsenosidivorans]
MKPIHLFLSLTLCVLASSSVDVKAQSGKKHTTALQSELSTKKVPMAKLIPSSPEAAFRSLNPIAPPGLYIADPEVRQGADGRIYLYGSKDEPGNAYCSRSYDVLSTTDLALWQVDQISFATAGVGKQTNYTDQILYAPIRMKELPWLVRRLVPLNMARS